jgi:hypothetical protein
MGNSCEFVDYDFCKKANLTAKDLIIWLGLSDLFDKTDDNYIWDFFGRNLMIIGGNGIRVSCKHKDFDRWANSEEMFFDVFEPSERRAFVDFVIDERSKK